MNKIEQLLQQHCPNGVEWKMLGEVCDVRNGFAFKSNKLKDKGEPILRIGNIQNRKIKINDLKYFDRLDYKENLEPFIVKKGDILIAMSGATTGKIGMLESENNFYLNQRVGKFEPIKGVIDNNYLYHYLLSKTNDIYILAGGGAQPNLSSITLLEKLSIPLPPLAVQEEIVRILDTFTTLETELEIALEAELELREKQYDYYRNKLLTFKQNEVEWKTLGEISRKIYSGGTPKTGVAEYWEAGTIPWMSSGEVNFGTIYQTEKFITAKGLANSNAKFVPVNSIVIALAGQGKTRGKVARIKIELTTNQSLAALTFNNNTVSSDYVYHYMVTQYEKLRQISSGSGTRGGLNLKIISSFPIPLPPLSEQKRIADILDKFDTLTTSISEDLPKETALRKKQYEYYREQLLSFPKVKEKTS